MTDFIGRRMGGSGFGGGRVSNRLPGMGMGMGMGMGRRRRPRSHMPYQYAQPYYPYPYPYPWPVPYGEEEEVDEGVILGRRGGGGGAARIARPGAVMPRRRRRRRPDMQLQPQPLYEEPQPPEELSEEDEIDERERSARRKAAVVSGNELFSLLPILAPGSEGMTFDFDVDASMCLHVAICVDGQCYEASTDLSSVLSEIARRVAADSGTSPEHDPAAVQDVSHQADQAVESAGLMLVGALFDQHVGEISAGFFDSIKSAYQTVSTPVTWFNKQVFKVLQYPPIKAAVTTAASAVATAYGGPAAGAAAAQFVGPVIDSSAETGGDPLKHFEDAKKEAVAQATSPQEAQQTIQAIDTAKTAIAQTAAAYHLTGTASAAAAGDGKSAAKIAQLEKAADAGDAGAIQAMRIIAEAFAAAGIQGGAQDGGIPIDLRAPSTTAAGAGWYAGADPAAIARLLPRDEARAIQHEASIAAQELYQGTRQGYGAGARFIGFQRTRAIEDSADASWRQFAAEHPGVTMGPTDSVFPLPSDRQAFYWLEGVSVAPDTVYAAWYDTEGVLWPAPVNETFGAGTAGSWQVEAPPAPGSDPTTTGALFPWIALAAAGAGFAAYKYVTGFAGGNNSPAYARYVPPAPMDPTTTGSLGILPWIAMAAAGGAGWTGRGWWEARKVQLAAEAAASAAELAVHDPTPTPAKAAAQELGNGVLSQDPAGIAAPATASGWW